MADMFTNLVQVTTFTSNPQLHFVITGFLIADVFLKMRVNMKIILR